MLNVIEVGPQVNVNDSRLALHYRLSHPVHRLMSCPFRSVSVRPRLEISFEDRLQNELECPLNHTITDCRNRQNADLLAPVLRNLLLPCPHGPIRLCDPFIPYLLPKTLLSAFLAAVKRYPVNPGCPVVACRHPVGFLERLHLADVDVYSPEPPACFRLRLT